MRDPTPAGDEIRRGRQIVRLHHPDQLWWRAEKITKRDTIEYYRAVAPVVLPHVRNRPLTLKQHYNGPRSPFRWLKDAPPEMPDWIPVAALPAKSRGGAPVHYALVNDELALAWMIDYGCVDLHVWTARADRPDRPDYVLFDLDPAGVPFTEVVEAAVVLREALELLELESLAMTTGGEGLHVRVPIARRHTHAETRTFAEVVAGALVRSKRGSMTTERSPRRRHGVYVDTKMNGHGQQVVAPYSVRPRPGAPVVTALLNDELNDELDPQRFTPSTVRRRVEVHGDLFAPLLGSRQRLPRALRF